jgi:hypothetical protein
MSTRLSVCNSEKSALKSALIALAKKKLNFEHNKKHKFISVPMVGPVQPFTIFIHTTPALLIFSIPFYLTMPPDLDSDQRRKVLEKSLKLNDRLGLIKISLAGIRDLIVSIEIPWRHTVLTPTAVNTFLALLDDAARKHQRDFLKRVLYQRTESREMRTEVEHGS